MGCPITWHNRRSSDLAKAEGSDAAKLNCFANVKSWYLTGILRNDRGLLLIECPGDMFSCSRVSRGNRSNQMASRIRLGVAGRFLKAGFR